MRLHHAMMLGEETDPPLGWRYDRNHKTLVPRVSTPEGKAVRAMIALPSAAWRSGLDRFGIPEEVSIRRADNGGSRIYHPGFAFDEPQDVLYLLWGSLDCYRPVIAAQTRSSVEWHEVGTAEWLAAKDRMDQE
jgi:hypothetical protein